MGSGSDTHLMTSRHAFIIFLIITNMFTLTAFIESKTEVETLTSASGRSLQKAQVIIKTIEAFPRHLCLECWNEVANSIPAIGDAVEISADVSSHQSKQDCDRWFSSIKAIKFQRIDPSVINDDGTF